MSRKQRIVVADSDRALLEMLQIRLDLAGYQTAVARTGPQALELVQLSRPALLLADIKLPELDGFGLLEELHLSRDMECKVMLMARQLAPQDVRRAAVLGVKSCIAKPFGGADILDRVAKLLDRGASVATAVAWV